MTRAIITLPLVSDPDDRQYVTLFSADVKGVHIHKADALWSNVEVRIPSIKVHVEGVDIPQYMYYSIDYRTGSCGKCSNGTGSKKRANPANTTERS